MICPHCGKDTESVAKSVLDESFDRLELPIRAFNCLNLFTTVRTIGDVAAMTERELLRVKNLGKVSVADIKAALAEVGLTLADASEQDCLRKERAFAYRNKERAESWRKR